MEQVTAQGQEATQEVKKKRLVKPKEKITLTVQQLQADLDSGLDRKGIAEKYNLPKAEVTRLFKHPKLKGKKTKVTNTWTELVDADAETETGEVAASEVPAQPEVQTAAPAEAVVKEGIW